MSLARGNASEVIDAIICGICHEIFIDPCTLWCGHTWCERCLRDLCRDLNPRCPACRDTIRTYPIVCSDLRKAIEDLFPEAVRERRGRLPPDEMPRIEGGFRDVAIERLLDVDKLVGEHGGMALQTQVIAHGWGDQDRSSLVVCDIVNIGEAGRTITIEDVCSALRSIPADAWRRDRSYYWEGIRISADKSEAYVLWGS